ncbi:MAG TPA: MFS transporter [Alcaligenes sp.]|nr:MFS transporter [Alcaligenes faecalis]HRL22850.1 MFS transporter [Alcaligenes sp.]
MASIPDPSQLAQGRMLSVTQSILAMMGLCFVVMLVAIDQTVVGTAMPNIVAELNGFELYAWVATSYLLTSVITVPIFGRLGDFYGRRRFVVVSIILFTVASVLCGMAQSMMQLVLARALQGVAGGMLVGTAFACIPDLFPDPRVRLRWQVMMSTAFGIANGIGPFLGGLLTEQYGWRSVFYVNLPIGLLSLYFVYRYLPLIRHFRQDSVRLDWQGALLLMLGLGCVQLLVELLPQYGASTFMVLLGVVSLAAFVALAHWEQRAAEPLLPPALFANPAQLALLLMSAGLGFILFSLLFYGPLLLQGGLGLRPQTAGLLITPLVVFITVGSIINGRVVTRLARPNIMLYLGLVLLALACTGMVFMDKTVSHWLFVVYAMAGGTGIGFVMPNLTVFSQEIVARSMLGIATAMLQSMRMVGGMLGTAVVGTLVTYQYGEGIRARLEQLPADLGNRLEDPQLLMSAAQQAQFLELAGQQGQSGQMWLGVARDSLTHAVNIGMAITLVLIVWCFYWVRKVPPIRFGRMAESSQ